MKPLLLVTIFFALVSLAFFAFIVLFVPAKIDGNLVISNVVYFLLSGFASLGLILSLLFYFVVSRFRGKARTVDASIQQAKLFIKSARRGFLLSFLVVGLVLLNFWGLLNLLNGALLIGTIVLIEVYFVR